MKMRRDKEETPVKRLLIIQLEILQDSGGEGGGWRRILPEILGGFLGDFWNQRLRAGCGITKHFAG